MTNDLSLVSFVKIYAEVPAERKLAVYGFRGIWMHEGGVWVEAPMTIAMLMANTVVAAYRKTGERRAKIIELRDPVAHEPDHSYSPM